MGWSKFISMALAQINPQNELGDAISEPCVELNSFRVTNQFVFSFLFRVVQEWRVQVHIYGPCEDNSTEWVGRYHVRTERRTQQFDWYRCSIQPLSVKKFCMLLQNNFTWKTVVPYCFKLLRPCCLFLCHCVILTHKNGTSSFGAPCHIRQDLKVP